jgi:hypothetical protein
MSITSNTAGYSFSGGANDPNPSYVSSNSITSYSQMGGGKRRKRTMKRKRKVSKKVRKMTKMRVKSMKNMKKRKNKKKKRMKHRSARVEIIKSVESGLAIPDKSKKELTPSMQSFLNGIQSTGSTSTLRFSNFKSEPLKSKKKKSIKYKGSTRGGSRRCKSCNHFHKGGCNGSGCKKKKTKNKSFLSMFF